ncbi:MAG: helix-turn-helix domain-containing protein [Alphaproteobacteria bacterium]
MRLQKLSEAALFLAVSERTVKRLTARGELPDVRVGYSMRFVVAHLLAYVASHHTPEVPPPALGQLERRRPFRYLFELRRPYSLQQFRLSQERLLFRRPFNNPDRSHISCGGPIVCY